MTAQPPHSPDLIPADHALAVQLRGVDKYYGDRAAVRNLSLNVRRGEIYGLLGPNGAGKTTTLRMLLGLVRPTRGAVEVLGAEPGNPAALARLGALVEEPALYPFLTGRQNLRLLCSYADIPPERVEPALDNVGLRERGDDKVKGYSLGMRQRLGVAAALLPDPDLLVLDEPTNGLDPQGMASMRQLIRSLGSGDRTVIVSSHLLGEVEQICERVAVLRGGELLAEDHVGNLRGASSLYVRAEPGDAARALLERLSFVTHVRDDHGAMDLGVAELSPDRAAEINRLLVEAGIAVSELRMAQRSLEDAFISMTGEEQIA